MTTLRVRPLSTHERLLCRYELDMTEDEVLDVLATRPRGIIVGEAPGPNTRGDCAMFPWPEGSAGWRLWHMSGYASVQEYLRDFDRVNLWPMYEHSMRDAELIALELCWRVPKETRMVLCGARVRDAFGVAVPWFTPTTVGQGVLERSAITIPHPSGRNRLLNDEPAQRQVTMALLWAAHELEEL